MTSLSISIVMAYCEWVFIGTHDTLEPAESEVNKIKVKCTLIAKYLTTYVVSAGNSISSSIKIKKCKTLAFMRLNLE
jgi:hypothetical protein